MRVLVIGIDNCGSRIAGEFVDLNRRARSERRVQIVTSAYAVDNDNENLALLKSKNRDLQTIAINKSAEMTANMSESNANLMREESNRILSSVKPSDFYDTDAVFLVAGAASGLGSVGLPILAQQLKDRHVGKPIYALIVLPFETERSNPQNIYNTAVCLKSTVKVAEAVFLADNERIKSKPEAPTAEMLQTMNKDIVFPFYDLFCASEEVGPKYAGAMTLGIGDMLQTLSGWTAIGIGQTEFPISGLFRKTAQTFQEKGSETQKIMEAMTAALGSLSIDFKATDTGKALYLLSIPAKGANVDMVKTLGNRLRELTNNAEIRGGDFYGARDCAQVTLVLSRLNYVEAVKNFYDMAVSSSRDTK
jgi:cell division GTPase FtsZ